MTSPLAQLQQGPKAKPLDDRDQISVAWYRAARNIPPSFDHAIIVPQPQEEEDEEELKKRRGTSTRAV